MAAKQLLESVRPNTRSANGPRRPGSIPTGDGTAARATRKPVGARNCGDTPVTCCFAYVSSPA